MTGTEVLEKVREARRELDKFNLSLAEYRMQYGMSSTFRCLYCRMGQVDETLVELENLADMGELVSKLP